MVLLSNLHNNSILTGSLDSYCLVCDNYLRSEDEAFVHTEKPIHKKNMDAAVRLEKYKNDQIIKVKKGYYCTFCNILLSTTTKVGLHINDTKHQETKRTQMLKRVGNIVVAFEDVAINWKAWHGVMDTTCIVCNTEFDEGETHWSNQSHILKLIQNKCEFGDKYIYRKVDEESFFCLICSGVYLMNDKPTHHENNEHNMHYNSGKELKNKTPIPEPNEPQTKNIKIAPIQEPSEPQTKNIKIAPIQDVVRDKLTDSSKSPKTDSVQTSNESINNVDVKVVKSTHAVSTKKSNIVFTENKPEEYKINKKVNTEKTEQVNAKTTEVATSKTIDTSHAKTGAVTKQVQSKPTNTPTEETGQNTPEQQSKIKTAQLVINDQKIMQYMSENDYLILDENSRLQCVLCDVTCVSQEEMEVHVHGPHHTVMLKRHKAALKKRFVPTEDIKKQFFQNQDTSNTESQVKKPETMENNHTKTNGTLKEKYEQKEANSTPAERKEHPAQSKEQKPTTNCLENENDDKSKVLDNVDKFQKNGITINFTFESARCKRCKKGLEFDYATLEKHIEECCKEKKEVAKGKETEIDAKKIDAFMEGNYMTTLKNAPFCNICCIGLNKTLKDLTAHVNSPTHKANVLYQKGPETDLMKKVTSSQYMHYICHVETNLGSDIIVNNLFVLRYYSFHCVRADLGGWICELCKSTLCNGDQLTQHLNVEQHKAKLSDCNIVISLQDEFVREMSAGVYHCGYCNIVIDQWLALQTHFTTPLHIEARRNAEWNCYRWQAVVHNTKPMNVSSIHAVNFT